MKLKSVILLFISFTFLSCSLGDNNNNNNEVVLTQWNLIHVTGGIAGVDETFEIGDIIWFFDDTSGQLTVTNNNTDDTVQDGLDTGVYNYSFIDTGTNVFISINDIEFGALLIFSNNQQFNIDQNITSEGSGADGFLFTFEKSIVVSN